MIDTNEWGSLSELLSNLIVKYADALDIDSLPDPVISTEERNSINKLNKNDKKIVANNSVA